MSTAEPVSDWEAFGKDICRIAFEGHDADGGTIQELGVKHGVLIEESFDAEKHKNVANSEYFEEGMPVYVFAALSHVQAPAPVAWRWKRNRWPSGDWFVSGVNVSGHIINQDTDPVTIEPLYTSPAPHVDEAMVERGAIAGNVTDEKAREIIEAAIGGAKP